MDVTESGGKSPEDVSGRTPPEEKPTVEEKPVEAAAQQAVESPPAPVGKPHKKNGNGILIALVAVSVVAVLLLAATICLAVTGDFGRDGRFEMFEGRPGPPMMRRQPPGQRQDGTPRWRQDQGEDQDQGQQQSAPTAPQGGQSQ